MKYYTKDPHVSQKYNTVTNIKGSRKYPYIKMKSKVDWFVENYSSVMDRECWSICKSNSEYDMWKSREGVFIIRQSYCYMNDGFSGGTFIYDFDNTNSIKKARAYGWVIDNKGVVYDFNDKYFELNKYKISSVDLGLL
jgi:hypothetical protein